MRWSRSACVAMTPPSLPPMPYRAPGLLNLSESKTNASQLRCREGDATGWKVLASLALWKLA